MVVTSPQPICYSMHFIHSSGVDWVHILGSLDALPLAAWPMEVYTPPNVLCYAVALLSGALLGNGALPGPICGIAFAYPTSRKPLCQKPTYRPPAKVCVRIQRSCMWVWGWLECDGLSTEYPVTWRYVSCGMSITHFLYCWPTSDR